MSSDAMSYFTKENLDTYLQELAKEYRKRVGKSMPVEIVLIGGAAILVNYGFQDMTTDVDAVIHAVSVMRDAVNCVGDKFGLPNRWLNADFMRTDSYTPKLDQYSTYYKTFSNILTIRNVTAEYLIAMKLRSGRKYKHDLSDIIGILAEHEKQGKPITSEDIDTAVRNLYGSWNDISKEARDYISDALEKGNYEQVYASITAEEDRMKYILIEFEQDHPGITNVNNVDSIIKDLADRQDSRASILEQPRKKGEPQISPHTMIQKEHDRDR